MQIGNTSRYILIDVNNYFLMTRFYGILSHCSALFFFFFLFFFSLSLSRYNRYKCTRARAHFNDRELKINRRNVARSYKIGQKRLIITFMFISPFCYSVSVNNTDHLNSSSLPGRLTKRLTNPLPRHNHGFMYRFSFFHPIAFIDYLSSCYRTRSQKISFRSFFEHRYIILI